VSAAIEVENFARNDLLSTAMESPPFSLNHCLKERCENDTVLAHVHPYC
jgi:hypothetical protein